MSTQFDKDALARSIQFFSFRNPKDWAKSRKLDPAMGSEMLGSLYRTEMQGMEKILSEQVSFLLAEGDTKTITDLFSKAKGPMLKPLANLVQEPGHSFLLNLLSDKFQLADYSGRKAILSACERQGNFSHMETLSHIENWLSSRKKTGKSDEELARAVRNIISQIVQKDDILKVLKSSSQSLESIRAFNIEDLHPRLMQIPMEDMIRWLEILREDSNFRESLRSYSFNLLGGSITTKKLKLSKSVARYCTAVLAVMGAGGKDKILVDCFIKLDCIDQMWLMPHLSTSVQNDVLKKLLTGASTRETAIWHLEQNSQLVAAFKDKLNKAFEESSLPLKARIGLLLFDTGQIPAGRMVEYLKRISLYLELADHWPGRAGIYLGLAKHSKGYLAPPLHRCQKRDALFNDLQKTNPDDIPFILDKSLNLYVPAADDANDLMWLINKRINDILPGQNRFVKEAMMRETKEHPQNLNQFLTLKVDTQDYRLLLASVFNETNAMSNSGFEIPEAEQLIQYAKLTDALFDDWQLRQGLLSQTPMVLTKLGMANREFYKSYQGALKNNWERYDRRLRIQMQDLVFTLDNKGEALISRMDSYRDDISTRLRTAIAEFDRIAENTLTANTDYVSKYLKDCIIGTDQALEEQAVELRAACQPPLMVYESPEEYHAMLEKLVLYYDNLRYFECLEDRVNYKLAAALSLILERIFLTIKTASVEERLKVEEILIKLLVEIKAKIIASVSRSILFDSGRHMSNQSISAGGMVQVIFPGIMMDVNSVVRPAMVELA